EGARQGRLPGDPQRDRLDRAPHRPHVPGRRHRPDLAQAVRHADQHDAGPHVRPVRHQGRHRPGRRRRRRRVRPERAHLDRVRQDPPHEHGPLGVGGLRDRRARRRRDLAWRGAGVRRRVRRPRRARQVPQARPQPAPGLSRTRLPRQGASPPMACGGLVQTNAPAWRTVDLAKKAEEHGFDYVWTFDSHLLWQEPYVIYSAILAATRRVVVGPMVTSPSTRDWTVTASVFATLNEMYGNRTVCGIGRGDSAVRVTGGHPTTLRTLREAVHVIRELASSRPVEYQGVTLQFPWSQGSRLDVWVAAY